MSSNNAKNKECVVFFFSSSRLQTTWKLRLFFQDEIKKKQKKNIEEHWTTVNSDRRGVMGAFVETCHHVFSFQSKLLWRKTKVLR